MITPGVWTVSEFDDKPCVKYRVDDSSGWQYWVPQNAHYANGSAEDDARLIATAPKLLAECEQAYRMLCGLDWNKLIWDEVQERLRVVISEAKGEEPA